MAKNDQQQKQAPAPAPQEEDAQPEAGAPSDKVKLKILRAVGHYAEGDVVEVSPDVAAQLCAERKTNWGDHHTSYRCACTMEDFDGLKKKAANPETGGRVVVQTPPDPALEARIDRAMAARKAKAEDKK